MIRVQTEWNEQDVLIEDVRNERRTKGRAPHIPFMALFFFFILFSLFFFFNPSQNTTRLVYNDAFHMKLFLSGSAGVQLGLVGGWLCEEVGWVGGWRRRRRRRRRRGGVQLEESRI